VGAVTNQAKQAYLRESRRFREAAAADAEGRAAAEAAAAEARTERFVSRSTQTLFWWSLTA
jgi:hypothetical protein